jgi:hypothetical protein
MQGVGLCEAKFMPLSVASIRTSIASSLHSPSESMRILQWHLGILLPEGTVLSDPERPFLPGVPTNQLGGSLFYFLLYSGTPMAST